jgi:hypothetical protein
MSEKMENIQPEAIQVPKNTSDPGDSTTPTPAQVKIPENLTPNQALQVLVDAARLAQQRGIFTLEDAELVSKAIRTFTAPVQPSGPVPAS